jgi:hypothetical protein
LIAASFQIIFTGSSDKTSHARTLALAPLCLGSLLLSAYMYVQLAGIPEPPDIGTIAVGDCVREGKSPILLDGIRAGAEMFAIAGTVLATGATLLLFIVSWAMCEKRAGPRPQVVANGVVVLAYIAIPYMLISGYEDVVWFSELHRPGIFFYLMHSTIFLMALLGGFLWRRRHGSKLNSSGLTSRVTLPFAVVTISGIILWLLSTVVISSLLLDHVHFLLAANPRVFTVASTIWAAVPLGLMVAETPPVDFAGKAEIASGC